MDSEDPWKTTSYEGNKEEQLRRNLKASYEERFRWLEEAYLFQLEILKAKKEAE